MLTVRADGASRGNPGPASYGYVVYDPAGLIIRDHGEAIGVATNNHAEYRGVIAALEFLNEAHPNEPVLIELDSKLVVQQLSGNWKVKHPDIAPLVRRASELMGSRSVELRWIPREKNTAADAAANRALDAATSLNLAPSSPAVSAKSDERLELPPVQPRSIRAPRIRSPHTDFFLIRHGSTGQTEAGRISGGGENPSLSERGVLEAERVAEGLGRLAKRHNLELPSAVVHSPLERTAQTAARVAQPYSLPLLSDSRLREIEFGNWEGLANEELDRLPETSSWRGSLTARPPGGESIADLQQRVYESFFELVDRYREQSVAVVSHMMPTRTMLALALGGLDSHFWSLQVNPASISVLRVFGREAFEIYSINSCEHLP
jgi:probable phosphoglycerate mutase